MIKKGIITFLFALACFIPRIAVCESVPGVSLEQNISTGNLAAPAVFSNFGTQEFREEGYIKFAIQAYLRDASSGAGKFPARHLRNFARDHRDTLFGGTYFFFNETPEPEHVRLAGGESLEGIPELRMFFERYFGILRGEADEDARLIDTCVKALANGETDVFKETLFVPIKKKSIINDNRELTSTMVSV